MPFEGISRFGKVPSEGTTRLISYDIGLDYRTIRVHHFAN